MLCGDCGSFLDFAELEEEEEGCDYCGGGVADREGCPDSVESHMWGEQEEHWNHEDYLTRER